MKRIFSGIKNILHFINCALSSRFSFAEKIEVFRVLFSLYFKSIFFRKQGIITQKIFGFKVSAYGHRTLLFLFEEIFVGDEYDFSTSKKSPLIFDCGANIGMAVLYFKWKYPKCTIMAFEPNPNVFVLLERNVKQNNLQNVTLFNIGLSDSAAEISFFMDENQGTLTGSLFESRGGDNNILVKTNKLSSYVENEIDLVKMDIEGAETDVFKELVSSDKIGKCDRYIIEYHHRINGIKSNLSSFLKQFEDHGLEYNIRSGSYQLGSFQDILIDVFKDNSGRSFE